MFLEKCTKILLIISLFFYELSAYGRYPFLNQTLIRQKELEAVYKKEIRASERSQKYRLSINEKRSSKIVPIEVTEKNILSLVKKAAIGALDFDLEEFDEAAQEGITDAMKPLYSLILETSSIIAPTHKQKVFNEGNAPIKESEVDKLSPISGSYEGNINHLILLLKKIHDNQAVNLLFTLISDAHALGFSIFSIITSLASIVTLILALAGCTPYTSELLLASMIISIVFLLPSLFIHAADITITLSKFILKKFTQYMNNKRRRRIILENKYSILNIQCQRGLDYLKSYEQNFRTFRPRCQAKIKENPSEHCYNLRLKRGKKDEATIKLSNNVGKVLQHELTRKYGLNNNASSKTIHQLNKIDKKGNLTKNERSEIVRCLIDNTPPKLILSGFPLVVMTSRASQFYPNLKNIEFRDEGDNKSFKLAIAALYAPDVKVKENPFGHDILDIAFLQDHGNPLHLVANSSLPYVSIEDCKKKVYKELDSFERKSANMMKDFFDFIYDGLSDLKEKGLENKTLQEALEKIKEVQKYFSATMTNITHILNNAKNREAVEAKITDIYNGLPQNIKDIISLETIKAIFLNDTMLDAVSKVFKHAHNLYSFEEETIGKKCKANMHYDFSNIKHSDPDELKKKVNHICEEDYDSYAHCLEDIHETFRKIYLQGLDHKLRYGQDDYMILRYGGSEHDFIQHHLE